MCSRNNTELEQHTVSLCSPGEVLYIRVTPTLKHTRTRTSSTLSGELPSCVQGQGIGQRPSDSFVIGPQSKTITLASNLFL